MAEHDPSPELTAEDMKVYVKLGNSYMKAIYYEPCLGPTDGSLYIKKGDNYIKK
jgi:hypothetical protein